MTCAWCGVRNVDFASTCFSCRQPLGRRAPSAAVRPARRRSTARTSARRQETKGATAPSSRSGGVLLRVLLWAAVAWVVARGLPVTLRFSAPESGDSPPRAENPVRAKAPVQPVPPQPGASGIEEQNGFRLAHFEWGQPTAGPGGRFHVGETVTGRSEIQGFGVTEDRRIDVTVALAFRDPAGRLVEAVSPTVLRQPVQSDTLFTNFDYAIPAEGPAGEYDLELAVDDAVSGRAARFHRKISVEARKAQ